MTNSIIGMEDMMAVYEVTDLFGIDRETISVPLEKVGDGEVRRQPYGLEIVVPASIPVGEWLQTLKGTLVELGYELQEEEDEWS